MADALSGLAEMQLSAISVYMAFLAGWIATIAGDSVAAERALRDALALIRDPDDHWYLSMIQADLTQAMLAQGRIADATEAIAELDAQPIPCDTEWVILRHLARARLAACTGEHRSGLDDARSAVAIAERTDLVLIHANALCAQAELLAPTGDAPAASAAVRRALELQEAKACTVAAAATRARFAQLLSPVPVK
jgi:ATP/maltotriose-dependent transcriptional regulator MalT